MAIQAQLYADNVIGGFPLGGTQDWPMENGNGGFNDFCFNHQQRPHSQQMNQNLFLDLISASKPNAAINNANRHGFVPPPMSVPSQSMAMVQAEEQRQELDRFISLQNERLRLVLQEQSKRLLSVLLTKFESRASALLKQKDEQMAQAAKRTVELENFLRKLQMEGQAWQRAATESESMVQSLNTQLEELKQRASNGADADAESCCDMNFAETGDEIWENGRRNGAEEQQRERSPRKMLCKSCNSRRSCVMFLPCRHLCSCKDCENLLHSCPICRIVKKASIEVLTF